MWPMRSCIDVFRPEGILKAWKKTTDPGSVLICWGFKCQCQGLVTVRGVLLSLQVSINTIRQEVQDSCMQKVQVQTGSVRHAVAMMSCSGAVWGTCPGSRRPQEAPWSSPQDQTPPHHCKKSTAEPHRPSGPVCAAALKTTLSCWWKTGGWKSSGGLLLYAEEFHGPWSGEEVTGKTITESWIPSGRTPRQHLPSDPGRRGNPSGWRRPQMSPEVQRVWQNLRQERYNGRPLLPYAPSSRLVFPESSSRT